MAIKVVQWGTGTAGLRALRAILNNPALELVGLYVARAERAGRDAGSFVDMPDTGVITTNSLDELLAIEADCLVYMGSFARGGFDDILPFLKAGRNIVTPTLFELLTPQDAPAEILELVSSACEEGNSSFFSTGASPGFCTDFFPTSMLGIVDEIREIRVQEIADYSVYPVVEVAHSWGFGAQPGDPIPLLQGDGVEKNWHSIPRDIARRIGVEIDEIRIVHDVAIAKRDVPAAFYTIPKGTVCGLRFEVQGLVNGKPLVILEHVNYCDYDSMPDHWPRPNAGNCGLAYRTVVKGRPNLEAEIVLDYAVAAVRAVNAIPAIVAAPPGVVAGSDVPPLNSGNVKLD
ncbi:hypothetical protein [Sphingomonas montanisoli]|uniref:2,4-diaminopentanoate dehydrogenase C-terminal domain-containing protein n=1 Tax=Sphingomonas montanisoli TaxID=2606412 RepID=A0A5D9CCL2_9SPHN|nr:hypothetical protein [Sphingomonas montanisoli]TZG28882.1 hypothetical protein FYJ91_01690 [Sphingomonas montanisoli]